MESEITENLNDDELRGPTKALCKINKDDFFNSCKATPAECNTKKDGGEKEQNRSTE